VLIAIGDASGASSVLVRPARLILPSATSVSTRAGGARWRRPSRPASRRRPFGRPTPPSGRAPTRR
jgi:hypothetical protein